MSVLPMELVSKIVSQTNALSNATFQMQMDYDGKLKYKLNATSPFVGSITKLLETIAECICKQTLLIYLHSIVPFEENYPVEKFNQVLKMYTEATIGGHTPIELKSFATYFERDEQLFWDTSDELFQDDVAHIMGWQQTAMTEIINKLSGLSPTTINDVLQYAADAVDPKMKQFVERNNRALLDRIKTKVAQTP
jgi:hypothetical protein